MKRAAFCVLLVALAAGCDKLSKSKHGRLERNEMIYCDSNAAGTVMPAKIVLTDAQAKEWGAAMDASGNCEVKLLNPELRSPTVAIKAGGNARIVIEGGIIEGGTFAMELGGNAQVEIQGTEIIGEIKKSANAKVVGLDTAKKSEAADKPAKP